MGGNTREGTGTVRLGDEMRAFDMLGPMSRQALREARYQIGAASLVRGLVDAGVEPGQFTEPAVDRAGVRCIHTLDSKLAFQFAMKDGKLGI